MINANELRRGVVIEMDGKLYQVMEYQHVKQKRTALARVKLRDIQGGHSMERTFSSDEKLVRARLDMRDVQFLYSEGDLFHFMDKETFEQTTLSREQLGDAVNYLTDGLSLQISTYKGETVGVELPVAVELKVTRTEPGLKGDTVTAGTKPATLETGLTIQVPLFINEGDVVKVDTRSATYLERAG